jgi:transcription elongation factor Elf1
MIRKTHYATTDEYRRIHRELRRRLQKEDFDRYFKCAHCGSHVALEIHIPNCDPRLVNQPGFYTILCNTCHRKHPSS